MFATTDAVSHRPPGLQLHCLCWRSSLLPCSLGYEQNWVDPGHCITRDCLPHYISAHDVHEVRQCMLQRPVKL